jgi:hypothetical protein
MLLLNLNSSGSITVSINQRFCDEDSESNLRLISSHRSGLMRRAGLFSSLNFISQIGEMPIQLVVQLAFDFVCCEVADQGSLSRIRAKFFDRSPVVFHGFLESLGDDPGEFAQSSM